MIEYYIAKDGNQSGPFDEADIVRKIETGVLVSTDLCWREGLPDWQSIGTVLKIVAKTATPPPIPASDASIIQQSTPLFLYIPVSRLIVLSIVSMSLFEAYWIYKNWQYVKERDGLDIKPFWRGFFGIFYCHSLLRRIHGDQSMRSHLQPVFSPGGLATGWVVLSFISTAVSHAPSLIASMIAAFVPSFLCLVPVQNYIIAVTEMRSPDQKYYGWSSGHIVCLVFGVIVWALVLIGLGAKS